MTAASTPAASIAQLKANGAATVLGTVVNPAGLTQAKMVPIGRIHAFAAPGLGSQSGLARLRDRPDRSREDRLRRCRWRPARTYRPDRAARHRRRIGLGAREFFDQDGTRIPMCSRGTWPESRPGWPRRV